MTTGWRHPKPPIRSRSRRHRRRGVLFLISFFFCFFFLRTHSVICEKKVPPSDFFFRFVHVFFPEGTSQKKCAILDVREGRRFVKEEPDVGVVARGVAGFIFSMIFFCCFAKGNFSADLRTFARLQQRATRRISFLSFIFDLWKTFTFFLRGFPLRRENGTT